MNSLCVYIRRRLIIIVLLFSNAQLNAADLDGLKQHIGSYPVTTGHFEQQRFIDGLIRPLQSRGEFIYHQDLGIAWHVQHPISSLLVLTAQGSWLEGKPQPQLSVVYDLFSALLTGKFEELSSFFYIDIRQSGQQWRLELVPIEHTMSQFVDRAELTVGTEVEQVILYEPTGDYTVMSFSRLVHPSTLNPEQRSWFDNDG